ncbi:MAG TPA: acyl-CoA dehydrogenase family protein [Nitrososphaerales archaeon]|nr:acyl-CoA dehydrogenase family protein [Nitrososphaerales archaeon]
MYAITPEQQLLRDTVREFAEREIVPEASRMDRESSLSSTVLSKLPSLGLFGVTVPTESGGSGTDFLTLIIVSEELSKASGSLGACVSLHNAVVCEAFRMSSNAEMRESILPKLCSGALGAFSFSNESSQLTCTFDGSEIIVDGSAEYVVSAADAGIFVFSARLSGEKSGKNVLFGFARSDVNANSNFSVTQPKKMLGMRASGTAGVSFRRLKLPASSVLVDPIESTQFIEKLKVRARFAIAAQALGIAQASVDSAIAYANERKQFNTKIGSFYAIKDYIASDLISIETARAFLYSAVSRLDINARENNLRESAIAKVTASDCAVSSARHAVRVHGGYGFLRDYPVERFARDARFTQIFEVSNETLKSEIAVSQLSP